MASASFDPLATAISQFKAGLTAAQRAELLKHSGKPDATSILAFTAEIDKVNADRRSRCVSSRLFGILESVKEFSTIADTFVSSHPEIAALVWGSLKFTILIANNVLSFFDKLSEVLLEVGAYCPRYSEYRLLFADSPRLQKALSAFYATVVNFCSKALHHVEQPASTLVNAIWSPFEKEFKGFRDELRERHETVTSEIQLASEMAAAKERLAAVKHRKCASAFRSEIKQAERDSKDWRVRKEQHEKRVQKENLLEKLSTYDYVAALRRMRKKRHGETSSWLGRTETFTEWLEDENSGALWLSGIVGAGKSVVTASAISSILGRARDKDEHVAFFFCEYDNSESLKARTILGSLIRQCLTADTLPATIEKMLQDLFHNTFPDAEDLEPILEAIARGSKSVIIVIDGFDECDQADRRIVLRVFQRLISSLPKSVKVFISSREDVIRDIGRTFNNCRELNMACDAAREDISSFVKDIVDEKLENGELVVGDPGLLGDIQKALIEGANGMFLWVAFQIKDLCRQTCDADLRKAIAKLPRDLTQTYNRILIRISKEGKADTVQNVFRWVGAAKRPLSLGELHEAIAVHPHDRHLQRDRLVNDAEGIITWCNNLVIMDEEDLVVQFAHHSVEQFLVSDASNESTSRFHFQKAEADDMAGIACLTYLNFTDFERQIALRPRVALPIQPKDIAIATSTSSSRLVKYVARLAAKKGGASRESAIGRDISQFTPNLSNIQVGPIDLLQQQYPFLVYARDFWLPHTRMLEGNRDRSWVLWTQLVSIKNNLAFKPWINSDGGLDKAALNEYVITEQNLALIRGIGYGWLGLEEADKNELFFMAIEHGNLVLVESLLQARFDRGAAQISHSDKLFFYTALHLAKLCDSTNIIRKLLHRGSSVNFSEELGTSFEFVVLLSEIKGTVVQHHEEYDVMLRLASKTSTANMDDNLSWGTGINGKIGSWEAALRLAVNFEHDDVVKLFLDHGANVNMDLTLLSPHGHPSKEEGQALHIACSNGNAFIAEMLVDKGADVNCLNTLHSWSLTTLMAPSWFGYKDVVKFLLDNKAEVVDMPGPVATALVLASMAGHVNVVKLLLDGGADVNYVQSDEGDWRTALQAASASGTEDVVKLLLEKNANVNAVGVRGTALDLAKLMRHGGIIELLSNAGASTVKIPQDRLL